MTIANSSPPTAMPTKAQLAASDRQRLEPSRVGRGKPSLGAGRIHHRTAVVVHRHALDDARQVAQQQFHEQRVDQRDDRRMPKRHGEQMKQADVGQASCTTSAGRYSAKASWPTSPASRQ